MSDLLVNFLPWLLVMAFFYLPVLLLIRALIRWLNRH